MNATAGGSKLGRNLPHGVQVALLTLLAGLPAIAVAVVLLWKSRMAPALEWGVVFVIAGAWLGCAWAVKVRVARPLQTISNLLLALREEDFSIRASASRGEFAWTVVKLPSCPVFIA